MKVDTRKPRRLPKQNAWYYLPHGTQRTIGVYLERGQKVFAVGLPAKKLLRELKAVYDLG